MYRQQTDSLGIVNVPIDKLWGAQTQRSIDNFNIARDIDRMPIGIIHALAILKKSAAIVNLNYGLKKQISDAIVMVSNEIIVGKLDDNFPLVVWQTGSGTHTNMNINQVIANRINKTTQLKIHPNDHVNRSQSSNDSFPTAMNIATVLEFHTILLPALKLMSQQLSNKVQQFKNIIKIGRTHVQDATPLTLGQQFSGYATQIKKNIQRLLLNVNDLMELAQGGTAVGTGLNTYIGFDQAIAKQIALETGYPFITSANKFQCLATKDSLIQFHGCLNTLAVSLMKIVNDIRLLGSGPRCGFGQLLLPQNQPGSSIMPGKINPTQCQALTMICAQVMGNQVAVTVGGMNGHFQLNAFKPLIIKNVLHSIRILGDGCKSFVLNCLKGLQANTEHINEMLNKSLMLVTALNPHIGYDNAGKIAKNAYKKRITLKQSAINLSLLKDQQFDLLIRPENMLNASQYINQQKQKKQIKNE